MKSLFLGCVLVAVATVGCAHHTESPDHAAALACSRFQLVQNDIKAHVNIADELRSMVAAANGSVDNRLVTDAGKLQASYQSQAAQDTDAIMGGSMTYAQLLTAVSNTPEFQNMQVDCST